jgi:hypothetical protein
VFAPRNPSTPEASSNHSQTTLVHSTAYSAAATRGCPARTSSTNEGSSHTRWCTHVIGLTRQAVSPVSAKAAYQSPAATARRARHAHTSSTVRATDAHAAWPSTSSRASTPCSDWLET